MKRVLSWLLVLVMVFSMLPMAAFADGMPSGTVTLQSENGENHVETWTAPADGTLTVSMGAATPGWSYTIEGVTLQISGSEAVSNSYEVTGGTTYTIIFEAYNPGAWSQANGTISYALSFVEGEASEDGPVTKAPYIISDTALVVGDNAVILNNEAADATIFAFEPTETGTFTITADNASAVVGYWGAFNWNLNDPASTTNACEYRCTGVGQTAYIGVSGVDSCTLTIAKSGEIQTIDWVKYELPYTPDAEEIPACIKVGEAYESYALVNFNHSTVSLSGMLDTTGAKHADPENGIYIDYTDALSAYCNAAMSDSNPIKGYWPMDEHLYEMLSNLFVSKGWADYLDSMWDLTVSGYYEHVDVQTTVDEDGYTFEVCQECGALVWTDCPGYFEDNPIMLDVVWNGSVGTATVTLEPWSGAYYGARAQGAVWTVNGEEPEYIYVPMFPMAPTSIFLSNFTDAPVTYEIKITIPAGTQSNPDTLVIGENSITVAEGATEYYYHYEATEDGTLTLTMPETGWFYVINNMTTGAYGDWQYSDNDPVVNPGVVEVSAGDLLEIQVNTYDPNAPWAAPAGTLTFTAAFEGIAEETPVVAGPFKMYIEQGNLNKILYVTGEMSGYFGATSEVAAEGKDFYTETTSEGTRIYFLDGETKTYIEIIPSGTYRNVKFNTEPSIYYTYNSEYETYLTDVEGTDYFLGTYGTYNTVSASKASYLEQGNFPVHLCDPDNLPETPVEPEQPEDPEADTELTIEEAIALGESKNHNTYTEGKYYVTGTVKEVYNEKYGNMYVVDEAGNQLTIYGSYNADGSVGYSDMDVKPVAGDTVVLYGIIGQYNGTAQMKNAWIVDFQCGHELTHVEGIEPGCHFDGNIEYWTCSKCGGFWTDEACTQLTNRFNVVLPATGSNLLVHMDAVEPGCHMDGNVEYWICYECEQVWTDEALTQKTNIKSVVLPATGSNLLVHMDAVEPGCHMDGNVEYWICYECEQVWTDEALTQKTNIKSVVLPATGSNLLVHMDAVEPGCHMDGNVEYWICYECEQVWTDEALTVPSNIKNVVLPATGSDLLVHMDAVEPGCHYDGNQEYWICYECNQVWTDEALTQKTNIKNVIIPAVGGEVVHVEAVEPGCESEGNIEYWYCEECEKVWTDEALTFLSNMMSVKLAPEHTNLVQMEAVEPGCHYNGNIEYWVCYDCGGHWTDKLCRFPTNALSVVVPATNDDSLLVHMDAIEPGCHYNGQIEHWICYKCEQVWTDEALTQKTNIKNVVLPCTNEPEATHVEAKDPTCFEEGNVEYWYCEECEQVWTDEALTVPSNLKNVKLAALEHANVVHMEAVEPGCHFNGNIEYWVCYDCEQVWQDEELTQLTNIKNVVLPYVGSNLLVHMDAVEPGCHDDGCIEHWICYECEQVWADEALTQLTNIKNVVVPAVGGDVVHVEAVAPGCETEGNIEHWYCEKCEKVWTDEALTQLSNHMNVKLAPEHTSLVHMEAVEPGCHDNGNIEYWVCYDCGGHWLDELLHLNTNALSVVLPATGEGNVVHMEAVEPGCHYNGNVEYWVCYDCEKVWTDEALTQLTNIKNIVVPELGGDVIHVEAVEPGCETEGNIEYWYCEECEQVWADEARTQLTNFMNVKLAPTHANLVHMEAVEPGCHYNGNIEYWVCYDCGGHWLDELCHFNTNAMSVVLPMTNEGHVVHVEAVEPTCQNGNIEYWYCEDCEQVWQNEELTQLTNFRNVIVPATGEHAVDMDKLIWKWTTDKDGVKSGAVAYGVCANCGETVTWDANVTCKTTEYKDEKYKHYDAVTVIDTYTAVIVVDGEAYHNVCRVIHATCFGAGYTEYFGRVERNGKVYDYGNNGSGNVLERVAKLKHTVVEDKDGNPYCSVCGTVNPSTGDMIMVSVIVMILAGAAVVFMLSKKRRVA